MATEDQLQDLKYGVLDLYEKFTLQTGMLLQLMPSSIAMREALKETVPQFEKSYARHFEAVSKTDTIKSLEALNVLLRQAIQTLERKWKD
jgi:hypothetical protein